MYNKIWCLHWYEAYNKQANQIIGIKYRQLKHGNNMAQRHYNSIAFNLNHLRVGSSLSSWKLFCEILFAEVKKVFLNIISVNRREKRGKNIICFHFQTNFVVFFSFFTEVKLKTNLLFMVHVEVRMQWKEEKIFMHMLVFTDKLFLFSRLNFLLMASSHQLPFLNWSSSFHQGKK